MSSNRVNFTDEQKSAIYCNEADIIVSAAAGAGKTAVLTQRCAHLICDAPEGVRCDADQLLVLTFTDAAALEMRRRIVEAIRSRAQAAPHDDRLSVQLDLIESAQISTIHSFCLWMIRRWFPLLEIDPGAPILEPEEAVLLKRKTLDELFQSLYAQNRFDGAVLAFSPREQNDESQESSGSLPMRFLRLVEHYGLGEDRGIADFVLRVASFVDSLPDPDHWLQKAYQDLQSRPEGYIARLLDHLKVELGMQSRHCEALLKKWAGFEIEAGPYIQRVSLYLDTLQAWLRRIPNGAEADAIVDAYDVLAKEIVDFAFEKVTPPKGLSGDSVARKEAAKGGYEDVRNRLLNARLKKSFCGRSRNPFPNDKHYRTSKPWIEGLSRIAPYVETIVELVSRFRDAYAREKRRLGVLDFADLERLAYHLLREHETGCESVVQTLRRRFRHVLVDEFQDINPLQQALIARIVGEGEAEGGGHCFVVGDVKQCIYRFRLAEPTLFLDRLHTAASSARATHYLPTNFRSRPGIIQAVNAVFSRLIGPGIGRLSYDENAKLRPHRGAQECSLSDSVELHLLEAEGGAEANDEVKEGNGEDSMGEGKTTEPLALDAFRWNAMEREGFLIATRIRQWMCEKASINGRPLELRDVAVLIRAARFNAERIASMLRAQGIAAVAETSGSLLGALEVRDVLCALRLLDNPCQDIPLAGALRSGVFGLQFSDDDLVNIRLVDRDVPFHQAAQRYREAGLDAGLKERLSAFYHRAERLRAKAICQPVSQTLADLYGECGYLARACALPSGKHRRLNLLRLEALSRRFGTFRRQGLRRFLEFLDSLDENDQKLDSAALHESGNFVRVMSVHQSKGLEFPVVFLAGLGNLFNLRDRTGRMIFERASRIGLKVVDPVCMVEYPSLAHRLAAMESQHADLEEEIRIFYVAMTRAREKLVLVGTCGEVGEIVEEKTSRASPLTELNVMTARCAMDWLKPLAVESLRTASEGAIFEVHCHTREQVSQWNLASARSGSRETSRIAVSKLETLPEREPRLADNTPVRELRERLEFQYPHRAASSIPATLAASETHRIVETLDEEVGPVGPAGFSGFQIPQSRYLRTPSESAVDRGILMHRVLQHLEYQIACQPGGVPREIARMLREQIIQERDREFIDAAALEWFATTPLADALRAAGTEVCREFPFIASEPLYRLDPTADQGGNDHVVIRGIVDAVVPGADGLTLIDFKTDTIDASEAKMRSELYRPQVVLYASAMHKLWKKPVQSAWLVYLTPRIVHRIELADAVLT